MKYNAEMWDKMQDIMARYNDHMTHCYMEFDRTLDKELLKKATAIVVEQIPILKNVYRSGLIKAEWKEMREFHIDMVYSFCEPEGNMQDAAEKFLLQIIDETREPQVKILHLRRKGRDGVAILINHQVMDGGDLKLFYYYWADIYSDLAKGGSGILPVKKGSRSESQLYDAFSEEEKEQVAKLISYSKKQKTKAAFPFEKASRKNWTPKITKYTLPAERFAKLKGNCKKFGVSINDVVLAAFYRVVLQYIDLQEGESLGIPNMVNLRRYIPSGESESFCNLTSMVVANLGENVGADIFETAVRAKLNMDELKDNYPGLHGIALLKQVFRLAPHALAKFLIGTFFKNPLIGISNIGLVDEKKLVFSGIAPEKVFLTGSVKYPPYMQLALSTYRNAITFTVANYGTENDHLMFEDMFQRFDAEISAFSDTEITEQMAVAVWKKYKKKTEQPA